VEEGIVTQGADTVVKLGLIPWVPSTYGLYSHSLAKNGPVSQ